MSTLHAVDSAGRRRSPATLPGYHAGRSPRNKGMHYPADPPTVEEIIAVMRHASEGPHAQRIRALIAVLWRAGLRIDEALHLKALPSRPKRKPRILRLALSIRHGRACGNARRAAP